MNISLTLGNILLSAALGVPLVAGAAPKYSFTTFGQDGTNVTAINNRGDILGKVSSNQGTEISSYLIKDGNTQSLWQLGAVNGLNDHGVVVGTSGNWDWPYNPASIYKDGQLTSIPSIDHATYPGETAYGAANAINNNGAAVGYIYTTNDLNPNWYTHRAFLYENGVSKHIGFDPSRSSTATDINNRGFAVGYGSNGKYATTAFIYDGLTTREIGSLGGIDSIASSINDQGTVVGFGTAVDGASHAFIYENGVLRDLGTWGRTSSYATKINNLGQTLVTASDSGGKSDYYLYQRDTAYNLNDLIPPNPEWHIASIVDINDVGQIVGTACDQNGVCKGMLLNPLAPVPEPSTWGMLLAGITLLAFIRCRRV